MEKSNLPYDVLADFYDRLISGYPYEKALEKVSSVVGRKGIDLGTGSGKFAIYLCEKGHAVVGVDSSSKMLEKARENARLAGVKTVFVQSDVMKLDFTKVDFVTAMCDVVNYLSGIKDFEKLSKKVFSALSDGGRFIFDISSEYKLKGMVGEQFFEDREDLTYLWCNYQQKNQLVMNIAYFIPCGEENYIRRDEIHKMSIYSVDELVGVLEKVGFTVKTYGEKLDKLKDDSKRVFFFCDKK
ncbi:MAG: class I SAM-dependent methyltransferase [Clostridia bacterium]|nr:class I SAM-dependent methyltransferase [Clostridia bacterium]